MLDLPPDIEVLITEDGVYIEIEGFIRFLRSNDDVEGQYRDEIVHLIKIADYLEARLSQAILQKQLLSGEMNKERPN